MEISEYEMRMLEPEAMGVGKLNAAVRGLRELLYQNGLELSRLQEEATLKESEETVVELAKALHEEVLARKTDVEMSCRVAENTLGLIDRLLVENVALYNDIHTQSRLVRVARAIHRFLFRE